MIRFDKEFPWFVIARYVCTSFDVAKITFFGGEGEGVVGWSHCSVNRVFERPYMFVLMQI